MRARNRGSHGAARTGWQQRRPEVEVDENLILQTALTSPRGQRQVTEQVRAACEEERTCRAVATRQNRESGSQSGTRHASSFVFVTGFLHRQAFMLFDLWVTAVGRKPHVQE